MVTDRDYYLAHLGIEREKLAVMKEQLVCLNQIGNALENIDNKLDRIMYEKGIDRG
jgi:hypothetical protein